jgi:vancomycin resistance protein VanW
VNGIGALRHCGVAGVALAAVIVVGVFVSPRPEVLMASYGTSLKGRMRSQRHNAELGLDRLDGYVIQPGATFSFNKVVGTCSRDQGYRKAPVSYNGQLVENWGGGVCQTSTTLYNAALLAGMQILERNRHRFAPSYVPAGRDAAVAYDAIDLRFRNPYPFAVRIRGEVVGERLVLGIHGERVPTARPEVVQDVRQVSAPRLFEIGARPGRARLRNSGKTGYEVATYRVTGNRRELLSVDSYPAMHKIVEYR